MLPAGVMHSHSCLSLNFHVKSKYLLKNCSSFEISRSSTQFQTITQLFAANCSAWCAKFENLKIWKFENYAVTHRLSRAGETLGWYKPHWYTERTSFNGLKHASTSFLHLSRTSSTSSKLSNFAFFAYVTVRPVAAYGRVLHRLLRHARKGTFR